MNIQKVKISEIRENENNPRFIKDEKFKKLVKSIKEFPEMLELRPIIVNQEWIILGGNMRYKACLELKHEEVYIIRAEDLTEEQQKEFIIKDNLGYGEWDMEILANEWDTDLLDDWGMDVPHTEKLEAVQDDYEVPDTEEIKTDIVEWDIFKISGGGVEHRLICGSSTEIQTLEKLFENSQKQKADMIFTDPPYLMNFQWAMSWDGSHNETHDVILNDNLSKDEWDQFLRDFLALIPLYCRGAWYISFYRLWIDRLFSALADTKMKWRNLIIWKKENKNLSNSDYQSIYEPIFYWFGDDYVPMVYGWEENHEYFGGKWKQNDVWDDIIPLLPSIWQINRTKKNDLHPTMKPVDLIGRCIKNSSKQWELVLDLFLGSGTTMVASHQLGRSCYGVELDPKYCKVILERMLTLDPELEITRNGKPYSL